MIGIEGEEVKGAVSLDRFPLIFTLMSHAGWAGIIFVAAWVVAHWQLWSTYNAVIFGIVFALFGLMAGVAPQVATNIYEKRLFRRVPTNYDWLYYARLRMTFFLLLFCLNGSLLIWASGGLASPFIPFYIMVFTLALNYCKFPQPATKLTLTFSIFFVVLILLAEVPWVHRWLPVPIDDKMQVDINNAWAKKLFDGGFATFSMLVPLISMFLAALRTSGGTLPAPAETPGPLTPSRGDNNTPPATC